MIQGLRLVAQEGPHMGWDAGKGDCTDAGIALALRPIKQKVLLLEFICLFCSSS